VYCFKDVCRSLGSSFPTTVQIFRMKTSLQKVYLMSGALLWFRLFWMSEN